MQSKLSFRLLAGTAAALSLGALAAAWFQGSNVESGASVTVKLPSLHGSAKPGFSFR